MPEDLASAAAACRLIASRQVESSEHGHELFAALLEGMKAHVGQLRFAPEYLVRYLAGERVARALGLSENDSLQDTLAVLRLLPRRSFAPLTRLGSEVSLLLGRPLLQAVIASKLKGQPASYGLGAI